MVGALYQRSQEDLLMLGYTLVWEESIKVGMGADWLETAIILLLLVLWGLSVVWTGYGVGRNLLLGICCCCR